MIFLVQKKNYDQIEILNKININVFCYENKIIFPVYLSNQCFNDNLDLFLISNGFTSHYVYIKDFNRLMLNKTKNKNKKFFCKSCLQCFSSENVLLKHKKDCLLISKGQNIKLEKRVIEFKNFNRQISVSFKIYADFDAKIDACPIDNNLILKRNEKLDNYSEIRLEIARMWDKETLTVPIIIGALGSIPNDLECNLKN